MDILGTLLGSASGGAVQQAAAQLGLGGKDVQALLKQVVPALAGGVKRNSRATGGLQGLTQALSSGNHQRYLDEPEALQDEAAVSDGNAILGHLFGDKQVSRQVADHASTQTGLDAGIIKKFLPIAAAAVMGALSKQTNGGASLGGSGASGALGALSGLLDSDGDGNVLDDLLSLGKKFL